ncbi:MAG: hypothetical protein HOM68_07960 [Gemmatimonadetes bacterium]|jgi:hypothetical protein|nr:hypothetical protein [Gemmatimonadota bacterium]MBT5056460.1 hypothetical protein [Gemmatimonadota bacterium]MBT5144175.1 hypothetical protein [Gemmatimonadota bacterium]MBT5586647.1 hypothetical protein [Gemmatimonadota bacterium]MBT6628406.1 hypothetical protein [Gemmatimonadota bacterium]
MAPPYVPRFRNLRTLHLGSRALAACCLMLLLASCASDSPTAAGGDGTSADADFTALFLPPTQVEKQQILASWAQPVPASQIQIEAIDTVMIASDAVVVRIVSHEIEGERHVGAITHPVGVTDPLPVLLYCHFDVEGIQFESAVLVLTAVAGLRGGQFAYVIPAYRGQSMRLGTRSFRSEGERSPWDGEIADAIGLLKVAWTLPETIDGRAAALGLSAGATVALLAAVREPGIEAVVDYFGPSDFFGAFSQNMLRQIVDDEIPEIRRIPLVADLLVLPWANGRISTPQMRLELLRRSPAQFADRLPEILAHHGTQDDIVDQSETTRLQAAMNGVGGHMQSWSYISAGHSPFGMYGALARTAQFLADFAASP